MGGGTELHVVGGPTAGLVVRLGIGRSVIGRHQSCGISVPDAEMSREHAELQLSADGTMTLRDLGSSNGTSLEGTALGSTPVPFTPGQVVQAGACYFSVHPVEPVDGDLADDGQCGYVFNRRYRIRRPSPAVDIEFPVAQVEEDRSGFPWLMMGAPLVVAMGMAAVLNRPEYLLLAVMSPVMTLGSTMHDRKGRKRRRPGEATSTSKRPRPTSRRGWPCRRNGGGGGPKCPIPRCSCWPPWGRGADCGSGGRATTTSSPTGRPRHAAVGRPDGQPPLATTGVGGASRRRLPAVGVLGVAGTQAVTQAAARALALQVAVLHSPDDVRVVVLTDRSAEAEWDWVQWLPHTQLDPVPGWSASATIRRRWPTG